MNGPTFTANKLRLIRFSNPATVKYKIQDTREALFNVGLHENLITLAHLSYFPTNSVKQRNIEPKQAYRVFKMTAVRHNKIRLMSTK